jgi:hypothetical protein
MFKKLSFSISSVALILLCVGCSGGSNSTASTAAPTTSEKSLGLEMGSTENLSAFTAVVGTPFVMADGTTPMYDDLLLNLTTPAQQAKVPIARILLAIENPGIPNKEINNVFRIGNNFSLNDPSNGQAITFLSNLAKYNARASSPIEVYAFPDVEDSSQWEVWQAPTSAPTDIPSCIASNSEKDASKKAMLNSICWVSLVNRLIGGDKPIFTGTAYDNQSNYLSAAHKNDIPPFSPTGWTYPMTHADKTNNVGLNLGWISAGGIAKGGADIVDLNLIEVYDLYSNKGPYYDTVAYSDIYKIIPSDAKSVCSSTTCAYATGSGSLPFFPGYQYQDPTNTVGAVGSNIYQCAISKSSADLTKNGCNGAYTSNIDITKTPDLQMLESINYIKLNTGDSTPRTSVLQPIYPNAQGLYGTVVYLLSTQYAGPVTSYYTKDKNTGVVSSSKSLCIDSSNTANLCSCVGSKYNRYASCGDENGFGSWGNNLTDFKNFVFGTSAFMSTQGGANCPGNSCSPGLYMYDFIPQAWYQ